MYDILVAGELNPDLIITGDVTPEFGQVEKIVDSASLTIGSSAAIFACAIARLGLKVAIIGWCGEDVFGNFIRDSLRARGVDVSNIRIHPSEQTGLSVILNRGTDRAILTHLGLISALQAEDIPDGLLRQSRHLHVASYFLQTALQPGLPSLFKHARTLGLSTSLDPNWDPSVRWQGINALLPLTDVLLLNENEAIALSSASGIEAALEALGSLCRALAIKRGEHGAVATQGKITARAQALPVQVIDTVGAGDNFDAGFLYGWLNGWNLEKTLGLATVCGSLSTGAAGGTTAQPTLEEALSYVQSIG